MRFRYFLLLVCLALNVCAAHAADLEMLMVSPMGDDANSGELGKPVRTLHRAQTLWRERLRGLDLPKTLQISLTGGTYYLHEPLVLTAKDSPPEGTRLTIAHAVSDQELCRISGAQRLPAWRVDGKLWKTNIFEAKDGRWQFRDLYIEDTRLMRARTPNTDFFRVAKSGPDRRTSFQFKQGDLHRIANPTAAEIVFLHDWSISRIPIRAIVENSSTITFTHPIGNAAPHYAIDHFEPNPRYFLEGAPEFLDAPGEWHLDAKSGDVSYFPHPDDKLNEWPAFAPRLESLVQIVGTAERPVRNLTFAGLYFVHTHWPLPVGGYAGSQASFHEDRTTDQKVPPRTMVPAAVIADHASNCLFDHCWFGNLGGSGLYLRTNCQGNTVRDSAFVDIGANGVMVGETTTPRDRVTAKNVIERCRVTQCGQLDYGAVGVWVGIARDTLVTGCRITELPYTGISVGWKWDPTPTACEGNVISDNHIVGVLQKMSDGGGIYTLGRQPGTRLVNNTIHEIPVNLGRAESNGIFMDEGSSEIRVEGNTIYNLTRSPIRFHKAEKNTLVNNTLVAAPGVPHFRYNNASEKTMTFENNKLLEAKDWTPPGE